MKHEIRQASISQTALTATISSTLGGATIRLEYMLWCHRSTYAFPCKNKSDEFWNGNVTIRKHVPKWHSWDQRGFGPLALTAHRSQTRVAGKQKPLEVRSKNNAHLRTFARGIMDKKETRERVRSGGIYAKLANNLQTKIMVSFVSVPGRAKCKAHCLSQWVRSEEKMRVNQTDWDRNASQ